MKTIQNSFALLSACLISLIIAGSVRGQGTAFTYQGRLNSGGSAANGVYDFRFRLASDAFGNNFVSAPFLTNGVLVSNGLFFTSVDFGVSWFNGSNYWLEEDVRTN